jgi:hypothetical protein
MAIDLILLAQRECENGKKIRRWRSLPLNRTGLNWTIYTTVDHLRPLVRSSVVVLPKSVVLRSKDVLKTNVVKISDGLKIKDGPTSNDAQMIITTLLRQLITHQHMRSHQTICHPCNKDPLLFTPLSTNSRLLHLHLRQKNTQLMTESENNSILLHHPLLRLVSQNVLRGKWKLMKITMMMGMRTRKAALFLL